MTRAHDQHRNGRANHSVCNYSTLANKGFLEVSLVISVAEIGRRFNS